MGAYSNFTSDSHFVSFFKIISPPSKTIKPLRPLGLLRVKENEETLVRRKDNKITGFRKT